MIKVKVKSEEVFTESRKGDNGEYQTHHQEALLVGDEEIKKFKLRIPSPKQSYVAGEYTIASESLAVNRFGGLELGQLRLVPIRAASVAAVSK